MPQRKLTEVDLASRVAQLSKTLVLCRRDDAAVVKALYETRTVDDVQALDKVTFFDEFFTFLRDLGVWELLEKLDPELRKRASIPWAAMIGVYAMRVGMGVPSMPQTEGVILTDPALMALFGLDGYVQRGMTQRGVSRAQELPEVRGAFSGEAMVDSLVEISLQKLAETFNAVIKILAEKGYFPGKVHAVVDCTDFEATPKYRMRDGGEVASVTRKKRPDHRHNRHAPKVATTVWGWKIWLMFCPVSGMPIALHVDRINVDDRKWMKELVKQGQANLGGRLKTVAFDRGFWDGQDLYQVAEDVPFFIPGKSKLEITQEARRRALAVYGRYQQGLSIEDAVVAVRPIKVVSGRGKDRREQEQKLIVIGLKELDCPTYAKEPPGSKVHSKSFEAGKLNAAVVMEDPSYPRPEEDEKHLTILTCAPMDSAKDVLSAYDRFDERGVIENSGNKQAKREWALECPLEKSEAAVELHAHFVFMLMGLMAAFRAQQEAAEKAESRGEDTGMGRYRRAIERANRDKVVVFDGDCYAVIMAWEMAALMGVQMRKHASASVESILERYGVLPSRPSGPPSPRGSSP